MSTFPLTGAICGCFGPQPANSSDKRSSGSRAEKITLLTEQWPRGAAVGIVMSECILSRIIRLATCQCPQYVHGNIFPYELHRTIAHHKVGTAGMHTAETQVVVIARATRNTCVIGWGPISEVERAQDILCRIDKTDPVSTGRLCRCGSANGPDSLGTD